MLSPASMLGEARVSWITIVLKHDVFEVASLERRSALKFGSRETCSISTEVKQENILCTFCKYLIS